MASPLITRFTFIEFIAFFVAIWGPSTVKDRGNECKFVYLGNNVVSMIEGKIRFGPFPVLLANINEERLLIEVGTCQRI